MSCTDVNSIISKIKKHDDSIIKIANYDNKSINKVDWNSVLEKCRSINLDGRHTILLLQIIVDSII